MMKEEEEQPSSRWYNAPSEDADGGVGGGGPAVGPRDHDGQPTRPNRGGASRASRHRRRGARGVRRGGHAVGPSDHGGEPSRPTQDEGGVSGGPAAGHRDQDGESSSGDAPSHSSRGGGRGRRGGRGDRGGRGRGQASPSQDLIATHTTFGHVVQQGRNGISFSWPGCDVTWEQIISIWKHQNHGYIPPSVLNIRRLDLRKRDFVNRLDGPSLPRAALSESQPEPESEHQPPRKTDGAEESKRMKDTDRRRRRRDLLRASRIDELDDSEGSASAQPPVIPTVVLPPVPPGGPRFDRPPQPRLRDPRELRFFPPPPASLPVICANCRKQGHEVARCPGPVDQDGFVVGCPVHNTRDHTFDECWRLGEPWDESDPRFFEYLVRGRALLPPVRCCFSWTEISFKDGYAFPTLAYPLTRGFSLTIPQYLFDRYDFAQTGPLREQLGIDRMTSSVHAVRQNLVRLGESERDPAANKEIRDDEGGFDLE